MAAEAGNAPNMEAKAWKWGLELEDKFTDRYAKIEQSVMKQAGNITKAIEGNGAAVTKMENAVEHAATSVARSSVKVESALSRQATAALSGLSGERRVGEGSWRDSNVRIGTNGIIDQDDF